MKIKYHLVVFHTWNLGSTYGQVRSASKVVTKTLARTLGKWHLCFSPMDINLIQEITKEDYDTLSFLKDNTSKRDYEALIY